MNDLITAPTFDQKISSLQTIIDELEVSITTEAQNKLAEIKKQYSPDKIPADLSDKKNFDMVHKAIQTIKAPKIALEKNRKKVVAPLNEVVKKINGAAKPLKEEYEEVLDPWVSAKKDNLEAEELRIREEAEAERRRVEVITERLANIQSLPIRLMQDTSESIRLAIENITTDAFDFQEFVPQAEVVKTKTIEALENLLTMKQAAEKAEQERVEREKAEAEDKVRREAEEKKRLEKQREEQREAEAKLAKGKAELAEREAKLRGQEQALRGAQEKKEREEAEAATRNEREERAAAEEKVRVEEAKVKAAKQAEEDRLVKEERNKEIASRREIALKRRAVNIQEAMADIGKSLALVDDIITGKIRHVVWVD